MPRHRAHKPRPRKLELEQSDHVQKWRADCGIVLALPCSVPLAPWRILPFLLLPLCRHYSLVALVFLSTHTPIMASSSMNLMSRDEECCLKTALAFAVLRKRLENDDTHQEPAFCRGLMSRSIPTLPPSDPTDHLSKMMNVAVSTATPLCNDSTTIVAHDTHHHHSYKTLDGICKHLALQLCNGGVTTEWIQETLSHQQIKAVCTVWHCVLVADSSSTIVGAKLLPAIGRVLQDLYNGTEHSSVRMVPLVQLAEASVSIRLSTTRPQQLMAELHHAMGPELCLPVARKDLAYFVLRSRKPGTKILLRFCVYDLMEKLAGMHN